MSGSRTTRTGILAALCVGTLLLIILAPSSAHAAWTHASARIVDRDGSGYVRLLNVRVVNHAENDASAVTDVEFSDDGVTWYTMPYTGRAVDWVLPGESGRKSLSVRFIAADGTRSPVVRAGVTVDTEGPRTEALRRVRAAAGRVAAFAFVVRDTVSPRVRAELVVRGAGVTRSYRLGSVATGMSTARVSLRLPAGSYRWWVRAVDLAGWTQSRQVSRQLVVR